MCIRDSPSAFRAFLEERERLIDDEEDGKGESTKDDGGRVDDEHQRELPALGCHLASGLGAPSAFGHLPHVLTVFRPFDVDGDDDIADDYDGESDDEKNVVHVRPVLLVEDGVVLV